METIKIERNVQLLVEGKDVKNFMEALTTRLGYSNETIQIHDFGGVNNLGNFVATLVKLPAFATVTRLGIVRDAESDAHRAKQSVLSALRNAGLQETTHSKEVNDTGPYVDFWILPDNSREGMLETLLCDTIAGSPIDDCIADFFGCIADASQGDMKRHKARAHIWIATKDQPHLSVGVAAKRGYWDLDHDALRPLCKFLQSLSDAN